MELYASATVFDGEDDFYVVDQRSAKHIVRYDPARALRQVEASRRVLAEICLDSLDRRVRELSEDVVKALALTYSDHPDFRPEWRLAS